MILLIDASNIRAGGGKIHLVEILSAVDPQRYGFTKIVVCGPSSTLNDVPNLAHIEKHIHSLLEGNYLAKWCWRRFVLPKLLASQNAFLFVPGSLKPPFAWPYVTMCQNLLPLQFSELLRYGFSTVTIRLLILRVLHLRAYRHASGIIFLTNYCYEILSSWHRRQIKNFAVIPHGLNYELFRPRETILEFNENDYFQLVYISILDVYKHQDKIARAVINLNKKGHKVKVTFVGPAYTPSRLKLERIINELRDSEKVISYIGAVPYYKLRGIYLNHHAFIFGSTCETFGMILTEAMSIGMPILCSSRGSLKETVAQAAHYFDPLNIESIEMGITAIKGNSQLRNELSKKALLQSKEFDWHKCANQTFSFLAQSAKRSGF